MQGPGHVTQSFAALKQAAWQWKDAMASKERILALGLMSGTSCDGVDAALIETDGRGAINCGAWLTEPYDAAFHNRLRSVLGGRGDVAAVQRELAERHGQAVRAMLARAYTLPG